MPGMSPSPSSSSSSLGFVPRLLVVLSVLVVVPALLPSLLRIHAPRFLSTLPHISPLRALSEFDSRLPGLLPAIAFAGLAAGATYLGVRATMDAFKERGFKGRDLLKPGRVDEVPESMGVPAACIYLLLLMLFIPVRYVSDPAAAAALSSWMAPFAAMLQGAGFGLHDGASGGSSYSDGAGREWESAGKVRRTGAIDGGWSGEIGGRLDFPHHELAAFLSALLSLLAATMLGFLDDVFDIRWRYKLPIPIISSVPLLVVYYSGGGGTHVVVPGWPSHLRRVLGNTTIDLGPLYYLYISLLSTFCTNSINILAGINGVEVGQALVIAVSLCINDLLYLDLNDGIMGVTSSVELVQRHLFSLYLLLPFVGTCAGLLIWNRYPSRVFIGDTFCYFAGQTLAVAGVLGHFSKTLLLFLVPQILNFLLSTPQLFGLVPCPRHRVPRIHAPSGRLYPSMASFAPHRPAPGTLARLLLRAAEGTRIVTLHRDARGRITQCSNLTLLNAVLVARGVRAPPGVDAELYARAVADADADADAKAPDSNGTGSDNGSASHVPAAAPPPPPPAPTGPHISEHALWLHMMGLQVLGSAFAFGVRHWLARVVFP